ncbi:unnamed protein product [Dovyalis caffra]|uniref:Uncharacterized protein n=1 Tax=Dovyalis caffra TaxID=77055 RepID=A0AAV1R7Q2_9ROSI|nr:unnamed protein product [Dovyalis caffra]
MRIPLPLIYGLRCGESTKRRDIAEEEKDEFSKILHVAPEPIKSTLLKREETLSYSESVKGSYPEKSPQLSLTTSFLALVHCIETWYQGSS